MGMLERESVVTVMRDPMGIQGFQPFSDMNWAPGLTPCPILTPHEASHPPQPSP